MLIPARGVEFVSLFAVKQTGHTQTNPS